MLGSTQVDEGDRPVELGGPLPRRLLTALVAGQGQPVSDDRQAWSPSSGDELPSLQATIALFESQT